MPEKSITVTSGAVAREQPIEQSNGFTNPKIKTPDDSFDSNSPPRNPAAPVSPPRLTAENLAMLNPKPPPNNQDDDDAKSDTSIFFDAKSDINDYKPIATPPKEGASPPPPELLAKWGDRLERLKAFNPPQPPDPDPSLSFKGLIPAQNDTSGSFLTPPEYAYNPESDFNRYMGKEALRVSAERPAEITPDEIIKQLALIAATRYKIAEGSKPSYNIIPGTPIKDPDEHMEDIIALNTRHEPYLTAAHKRYKTYKDKSFGSVSVDNELIELSHITKDPSMERYTAFHPYNKKVLKIMDLAFKQLSDAFSSEPWDLDLIANSYRLLCHGTPYQRGTPAIIETFLDGMFRSKGWALPRKSSEPFWNAIFHDDQDGPYTWEKFISNFKR